MNFHAGLDNEKSSWLHNESYHVGKDKSEVSFESKRENKEIDVNDDEVDSKRLLKRIKHKMKHKKHRKLHKKHKQPSQQDSKSSTSWIGETSLTTKDSFHCDIKPDWSNTSYDTLYSGDLAIYRRLFGDHCVGLKGNSVIKFTDQRNISMRKKNVSMTQYRYYNKVCDSNDVNLLQKNMGFEETTLSNSFLPIEVPSTIDNESKVNETPEMHIMKKVSEYNTQLLANPHNVQLWMEFINFQDEALIWDQLLAPPLSAKAQPTTSNSTRECVHRQGSALIERKIAIFERALQNNPLSEKLLVGHMELVQEIWDTERLVKQWKDIVFKQPNRSLLWLKYIEFCQSRFSFYRSSSISSLYQKAISTLSSIFDGSMISHKPEPNAEQKMVALFLLYCYFLKHSGFIEKAIALLQALVEFNLCSPEYFIERENMDAPKARLDVFESFWDGNGARIGEQGAIGWNGWFRSQGRSGMKEKEELLGVTEEKEIELLFPEIPHPEDKEDEFVKDLPVNIGWAKLEMHREYTSALPGKLLTDSDCENDLDHTILFDDVSSCLFQIQDDQVKVTLLLEFLRFLGAPINSVSIISAMYPDAVHMIVSPIDLLHPLFDMPSSVVPSTLNQPRLPTPDLITMANCSFDDLLLNSVNGNVPSSLKAFITRLFNQSLSVIQNSPSFKSSLICSWLMFELHHISIYSSENVLVAECLQKLSMSLLPSVSIEHYGLMWNFINHLEPLLSVTKRISFISKALLHPFTSSPSPCGTSLYLFCQMFVECMLKIRKPINCYSKHLPSGDLALFTLVQLSQFKFNPTMLPTSGVKLSSSELVKASKYFYELSSHVLQSHSTLPQAEVISKLGCSFYFKYLTEGIESSCLLVQEFLHVFTICDHPQCNCLVEQLYVMVVKLLEAHSTNNHIKPQIIRDILCSALSLFPHHGWFLRMFIKSEEQSFNTGQLRRFFTSLVRKSTTTDDIPTLFAVSAEISRYQRVNELVGIYMEEPSSGILQRVRSYFVHSLQRRKRHSSPALWRAYIKFEVKCKFTCNSIVFQHPVSFRWNMEAKTVLKLFFTRQFNNAHG